MFHRIEVDFLYKLSNPSVPLHLKGSPVQRLGLKNRKEHNHVKVKGGGGREGGNVKEVGEI